MQVGVQNQACTGWEHTKIQSETHRKGVPANEGLDYKETFAPVVRFESLRVVQSLAASLDLNIIQLDVKTAFLNGKISEDMRYFSLKDRKSKEEMKEPVN